MFHALILLSGQGYAALQDQCAAVHDLLSPKLPLDDRRVDAYLLGMDYYRVDTSGKCTRVTEATGIKHHIHQQMQQGHPVCLYVHKIFSRS
jgi:hypothetical protein